MQMAPPDDYRASDSRKLKTFLGFVALTFAVTLAVIIGNRLSDQALAVLAGAVCGVGAAIPTSLLIVAIARRRDKPPDQPPLYQQQADWNSPRAYPPVIVVAPPGMQQPHNWNGYPPSLTAPIQREFTVVGGATSDREAKSHERYS
jgi:hypothetical protein